MSRSLDSRALRPSDAFALNGMPDAANPILSAWARGTCTRLNAVILSHAWDLCQAGFPLDATRRFFLKAVPDSDFAACFARVTMDVPRASPRSFLLNADDRSSSKHPPRKWSDNFERAHARAAIYQLRGLGAAPLAA